MRFWEKYKKRLCGGVFIQSKVKVGEYQEIWRSCFIFRRDFKSFKSNHLINYWQKIRFWTIKSTKRFPVFVLLRRQKHAEK